MFSRTGLSTLCVLLGACTLHHEPRQVFGEPDGVLPSAPDGIQRLMLLRRPSENAEYIMAIRLIEDDLTIGPLWRRVDGGLWESAERRFSAHGMGWPLEQLVLDLDGDGDEEIVHRMSALGLIVVDPTGVRALITPEHGDLVANNVGRPVGHGLIPAGEDALAWFSSDANLTGDPLQQAIVVLHRSDLTSEESCLDPELDGNPDACVRFIRHDPALRIYGVIGAEGGRELHLYGLDHIPSGHHNWHTEWVRMRCTAEGRQYTCGEPETIAASPFTRWSGVVTFRSNAFVHDGETFFASQPMPFEYGWLFANGAPRWRFDAAAQTRLAFGRQVYPSVEEDGIRFRGFAGSVLSRSGEFEFGFGEMLCAFEHETCDVQLYPPTEQPVVPGGDVSAFYIQTATDGVPTMAIFEDGRARVARFHGAP